MAQVRDCECYMCKHRWVAAVVISTSTQNTSGERRIYCPMCNKPTVVAQPAREDHAASN